MISRRRFCAAFATFAIAHPLPAFATDHSPDQVSLIARARRILDQHEARTPRRDIVGLIDFSAPSHIERFHIIDIVGGKRHSLLVAHGRGSDPGHSGWLQQFSNDPGSMASSAGAYLVGETYSGRHGLSRRLTGLDATNSNALERGLVIHAADYVSETLAKSTGKIGRSEGCLAISSVDHQLVLERLGPGCLIYADKI